LDKDALRAYDSGMSLYRPEFEAALRLLARVSKAMRQRGFQSPVLVGGAAVEIYSLSAINTGDFDISTGAQDVFEDELQRHGFVRPSGVGMATRGWIHPELKLGFEVVSATLLDGMAERSRVRLIDAGDEAQVAVIALEDIIADRMGQYASGSAPDMLAQAKTLFALYPDADFAYMDARIRYETAGEYGIDALKD
jgi:hypothetical protein